MTDERISILIVEDDEIYRESIQELINESEQLRCEHACESCEDAIELLKAGEAPEIILSDIDLPGMSGVEGIREFRTLSPATRVIMLTVFDDDEKIFNAICQGAVGYLLKSASSDDISRYLLDLINGGAAMSQHIAARVLNMFTQ